MSAAAVPPIAPAAAAAAGAASAAASAAAEPRTTVGRERELRMRQSLKALLDRVPGSRQAMPHLATLEAMLEQQGGTVALDLASAKTLAKMHGQLRVLPLDAADGPIQDLVALVRRALKRHAVQQTHQLSPFDPEATVLIIESSHSDFMDALGEARTFTPARPAGRPAGPG